MKLLSYDGPLAQTIRLVWRYFVLNLCFIICSLPIITIGATLSALFTVMLPIPEDTAYIKKFFSAFRSNFSQATIIWLIILIPLSLLLFCLYLTLTISFPGHVLFRTIDLVLLIILMSLVSYVFPLQARYDNPPKTTVRNAFILCIGALLPGLLMSLITLIPVFTFIISIDLFVRLISLWPFIGFSLTARLNSSICMFVFSRLDPPKTDVE